MLNASKKENHWLTYSRQSSVPNALQKLGEPLLTSTLILPDQTDPLDDPYDIETQLAKRIDIFINSGVGTLNTTSIIDLSGDHLEVIPHSVGDVRAFE